MIKKLLVQKYKISILAALTVLLLSPIKSSAATYVVDSTADTNLTTCSGAANDCTLRGAINAINSACGSGPHTIAFGIPGITSGNAATIRITDGTALPSLDCTGTIVDGTAQTASIGDTLTGTLGAGGTVGTDGLSLTTVNRPEVQIVEGLTGPVFHEYGLRINSNDIVIQGIAIYGFGQGENIFSDNDANIYNNGMSGAIIQDNILGTSASAFTDPGSSTRTRGANFISQDGDNGIFRRNLVGFANASGIALMFGASGWTISNNEVRSNGQLPVGAAVADGIDLPVDSSNLTISQNLVINNRANGIDMYQNTIPTTTTNTITNNTIVTNGLGEYETAGIRIYSSGNTVNKNIINNNFGAGVMVRFGVTTNTISQNSMYDNGEITGDQGGAASGQVAIDLLKTTDSEIKGTSPYYTINDSGDGDSGGNGLFNFPVITSAAISGGNLTINGFARPGSLIELFIADSDPSQFGEGVTYLTSLTEGSGSDTNNSTGSYSGTINGVNQGSDTTNMFTFVIATPAGVSNGTPLTATATLNNITSEFSAYATATSSSGTATDGEIGTAKKLESLTELDDGRFQAEFTIRVENTGESTLTGVQVKENLGESFEDFEISSGPTSSTFTANTNFDGETDKNLLAGTDTLTAGSFGDITLTIKFRLTNNNTHYENQVTASGLTPTLQTVEDKSQEGIDVDPDNDGDPTNNNEVTDVNTDDETKIGVAKKIDNLTKNDDGTYTVEYVILVRNYGPDKITKLSINENLVDTFGKNKFNIVDKPHSNDFETNDKFNGDSEEDLLSGTNSLDPGSYGEVKFSVKFKPTTNKTVYKNTAVAEGYDNDGNKVTDDSNDSSKLDPDPDDDGDPTNNNVPTELNLDPSKRLVSVGYENIYLQLLLGFTILTTSFYLFYKSNRQ